MLFGAQLVGVVAEQLVAFVAADLAEAIVGVMQLALRIGDADDGVMVERLHLAIGVALQALAITHQLGHHAHQAAHVFVAVLQLGQADVRQQGVGGIAQRVQRAGLRVGLLLQATIRLVELQALLFEQLFGLLARFAFALAATLLQGLVHTVAQARLSWQLPG